MANGATPTNEDLKITIWNNSDAPHSNNLSGEEKESKPYRVSNVTQAELLIFKADKNKATGQAVVICPGGGYAGLAVDIEGTLVAEWLAYNGITAAVLKYRMPNGVREVPFEDALEAIKIMRDESKNLGFKADRVGIAGGSAGGHLAASISTLAEVESRPNFTILFYPVISGEKGVAHEGSFNHLLGKNRSKAETLSMSLERHVDENTPATIMFHSSNDPGVPSENSVRYYQELKKYDTLAALYIVPEGGHGWLMSERVSDTIWQPLLLNWLELINKKADKKSKKQE